jgi:hypothetical protein
MKAFLGEMVVVGEHFYHTFASHRLHIVCMEMQSVKLYSLSGRDSSKVKASRKEVRDCGKTIHYRLFKAFLTVRAACVLTWAAAVLQKVRNSASTSSTV